MALVKQKSWWLSVKHDTAHTNIQWTLYAAGGAMGANFAEVFIKWFEIYNTIEMPSQLALNVFSSEKLWLHVEFLSLMQALEGFHRATMQGPLYITA